KTVIQLYFSNGWTRADFYIAHTEIDALIDTVPGDVDGIFVPENPRHLPPIVLTNLRSITARRHPRYGHTIIVGVNTYIMALLNTLVRLLPNDNVVRFVSTVEEAHALIEAAQKQRAQHLQS